MVSEDTRTHVAPDGGWGWFVVLGSFIIHVIMDGFVFAYGVLYIEFLDYFKHEKGETAVVGSVLRGMLCISGPIGSVVTNRFGCRVATVVGSLFMSVGFIGSVFVPDIYWLTFTFGVFPGIGRGFLFVTSVVSISQYFDSRRPFAMGIATSGTGLGTFIFSPLLKYLIDVYAWKGTLLIEAGIVLHCCISAALFRPLSLTSSENEGDHFLTKEQDGECFKSRQGYIKTDFSTPIKWKSEDNIRFHRPTPLSWKRASLPVLETAVPDKHLEVYDYKQCRGLQYSISSIKSNKACASSISKFDRVSVIHGLKRFSEITGLDMLCSLPFVLFLTSNCLTAIGMQIPFTFLPDRAYESGVSKINASFLVSVAGIANTIARIVFGWLGAQPNVNATYLYISGMFMLGLSTCISNLNDSTEFLMCYAVFLGVGCGIFRCLNPIVLVRFVGVSKLTSCLGIMLLTQGVVTMIGHPVGGMLFDRTGSYNLTFYLFGCLTILSGLLIMCGYKIVQHKDYINSGS